jgi:hypothetical protein
LTGLLVGGAGVVLHAEQDKTLGLILGLAGGGLAVLALLVEIIGAAGLLAGRRGAFGFNVFLQVVLAGFLVAAVNYFSFHHYLRWDWTFNHNFTLDAKTREDLSRLRGETTIVVYQRHKTFGQLSDKPDVYDYAAERKVIEKVKDLVDQFRELGSQFRVEVLDVEEEGFTDTLERLTAQAPGLRQAIDSAAENSIFFYANGKVQRLGFHDIYELDKQASQDANDGRGNLVLLYQGVGPFARKVLAIDEKKPRLGVAVIHELLGLEGSEELGMGGVKKALMSRGFEGQDVILKKWSEFTGPEPAVFTYDESKYERLEAQRTEVDLSVKTMEEGHKQVRERIDLWTKASVDDLTKKYADQLEGHKLTEADRRLNLANFRQELALLELFLGQAREEQSDLKRELAGLSVENLEEQRRISDLKAKADRLLADCDVLLVPRMTLFNVARGEAIPNRVYRLDDAQVAAIKDFLKAGKPVLFCFGPSAEPPERMMMSPLPPGPDKLEDVLAELGIKMSRQTVLFNVESKSFAERRSGLVILGATVEVPPVTFDWPAGAGQRLAQAARLEEEKPNPIRESMRLTARSLGKGQALDLRLRHPRPVYYEPAKGGTPSPFQPVFMMTDAASWNEDQPFPSRERTPRFELPKDNDPTKGTLDEKRRGPFPIAVAVETTVPSSWYPDQGAKPAKVRVAAIGHGGVFMGTTLPTIKEKLLLDTCNWLLGRDDLLTKEENPWQYPRVALTEEQQKLWQWGTRLGLPVLFVYLGAVVLMVRRLRLTHPTPSVFPTIACLFQGTFNHEPQDHLRAPVARLGGRDLRDRDDHAAADGSIDRVGPGPRGGPDP